MKHLKIEEIRKQNKHLLKETIHHHPGISRIELSKLVDLAPSTVTEIVNELLEDGILQEKKSAIQRKGRPAKKLYFQDNSLPYLLIEFRAKIIYTYVYSLNHELLESRNFYNQENDGSLIFEWVKDMFPKNCVSKIGLLVHDDTQLSDLNVLYDTGYVSQILTIRDALKDYYHCPVEEQVSGLTTLSELMALSLHKQDAFICVSKKIEGKILLENEVIPLNRDYLSEIFNSNLEVIATQLNQLRRFLNLKNIFIYCLNEKSFGRYMDLNSLSITVYQVNSSLSRQVLFHKMLLIGTNG
ncbi:winged helix-turn-helix domain-containing protein [Bulleidia sp. zg-1006]|uniref:winged helix-turn-helix domain-containing protein n=1 Tax=Bulleidia sp. zg-1006 TaxID=2806552 RepID=UPI0019398969|nr:winged helix-turn-helix domain-containing protein [Bulleidia sp. zg-1006]QRG86594.1 winged helix-turn-helix domain-containing protein [Bulleidia sp. zg-1006]